MTMELIAEIIAGANIYSLSDGVAARYPWLDDLASPTKRLLEEAGPMQHGTTVLGYRYDARTLPVQVVLPASTMAEQYDMREALINTLSLNALKLRLTLPNSKVRQSDCEYVGMLKISDTTRKGFTIKAAFSLRMPDPTFYDPSMQSYNFEITAGDISNLTAVPLAVPVKIGTTTLAQSLTVLYQGNMDSYPTLLINGPVTDLVLTNQVTGEKLDFTGSTISAGKTYTVDCRYGIKTVKDETNASKISELTNDSNLATFHLTKATPSGDGLNTITVGGTGITSETQIFIQYYDRYLGV